MEVINEQVMGGGGYHTVAPDVVIQRKDAIVKHTNLIFHETLKQIWSIIKVDSGRSSHYF